MFGSQSNSVFGGGAGNQSFFGSSTPSGIRGSTFQNNPQQQQPTGTSVAFQSVKDVDSIANKNGSTSQVNIRYNCITVMQHYEGKSLEELRLEDYQLQRHRKQQNVFGGGATGLFVSSSIAPPPPPPPQKSAGGHFSSFGGTGLFGQQANTTASKGTGLFGLFSTTPENQQKTGGLFGGFGGAATTPAPGFGGTPAQNTFTFGSASNNPNPAGASSQSLNVFGQPQQQNTTTTAPATSGFGFGTSAGSTGTGFNFPSSQPQQQGIGLFSQPAASQNTGTATNIFGGGFGATPAKPLFGSSTGPSFTVQTDGKSGAAASSNNIFGSVGQQQQQSKPSGFQTPIFGSGFAPAMTTVSLSIPKFPSFGTTQATSFGNASRGFGGTQQQPNPGTFGSGPFPGGFVNNFPTTFNRSVPAYGGISGPLLQIQPQQVASNHNIWGTEPITFATTPFKDNLLFYDLLPNAELPKSSQRRTYGHTPPNSRDVLHSISKRSSGVGPTLNSIPFLLSKAPAVRRLTRLNKDKPTSLVKFKVFDGFDDDDLGVGVDVLSPKTDVKKLNLKTLEESLRQIQFAPGSTKSSPPSAARENDVICLKNPPQLSPIRNRRVRFTLPAGDSDNIPCEILFPGEERDYSSDTSFADSRTSYSSFLISDDGRVQRDSTSESGGLPTCMKSYQVPGSICGVVNTREGYYTKPSLEELDAAVDREGYCVVSALEIGRKHYGSIKFLSPVDIKNLDIDKQIHFRHKEVVVYPDDTKKPEPGQGLNVPAEICLKRVWPVDKATNELIRDPDDERFQNYKKRLEKACDRMGTVFVSYNSEEGLWKFRVAHF